MKRRAILVLLVVATSASCADWITDIPPFAKVDVEAVRTSGEPVSGARLTLYTGARIVAYGTTGADGRYRFDYLPKNGYGVYAEPPEGYVRPEEVVGGPSSTTVTQGLTLGEGGHGLATFTYLKVGPGSVVARITDPDGSPLADVPAALYNFRGVHARSSTDGNGTVRFDPAPFGLWGLSFELPRRFLDLNESALFFDDIVIEDGTQVNLAYMAYPCEGTITLTVREPSGTLVTEYPVQLYNDRFETVDALTGAEGTYAFTSVTCGNYGVRLRAQPGWTFTEGRGKSFADGIRMRRGSTFDYVFEVTRCTGELAVQVLDQVDRPVPGATLTLYRSSGEVGYGVSGARGDYTFEVPCGEYGLRITPASGYTVSPGRGYSFYDGLVIHDGGRLGVTFRLAAS